MGVRVDKLPPAEALGKAREFLRTGGQHKIFTPNPEMLVKANKDEYFRQVLNAGDLNLCDGFGLRLASGAQRITGVDFMLELCKLAAERGSSVYLLGSGNDAVIRKTAEELNKQFPGLKIAGYNKGPEIRECHCEEEHVRFAQCKLRDDAARPPRKRERCGQAISLNQVRLNSTGLLCRPDQRVGTPRNDAPVNKINAARPDILFVAFGMGKQEKWIHENLAKLPSVKIAMGVGGAFDYISGTVKRAPCWMRQIGLEWMYRLIKQPKRAGRIFNATIIFCIHLLFKHKNIKTQEH